LADKEARQAGAAGGSAAGDEYRDEYVRNWTTIWTNLLLRTGGMDKIVAANRQGMEQYLAEALESTTNKPYDQFATDLSAHGELPPGDKDFNGPAEFSSRQDGDNGIQATAKTAQIFLGWRCNRTQCHNHPFNEYQQNQSGS